MRFLKVAHIHQRARADCLVACAAMLLSTVDVKTDYARLQALLGFDGGGIPFSRLRLLAQISPNINVTISQGTLRDLMTAIDSGHPPAIFLSTSELPYWTESVFHAVVLTGYTATDFYINDPAFADAPQIVSMGDVDLAWLEHDTYYATVTRLPKPT